MTSETATSISKKVDLAEAEVIQNGTQPFEIGKIKTQQHQGITGMLFIVVRKYNKIMKICQIFS